MATTSGASNARRGRAGAATSVSASAKTRNVRWVPANGISTSAAANVPSSEPAVDSAYSPPVTEPDSSTRRSARRTA